MGMFRAHLKLGSDYGFSVTDFGGGRVLPQGKPCALTWKLKRTLARLGVIAILVTSRCLLLEF